MSKPVLAIVGNAPMSMDYSLEIEAADIVVRFNEGKNWAVNSGRKTDILCIRNKGAPAMRIIANKAIDRCQKFPDLSEIWFPINPKSMEEESENIIKSNNLEDLRIVFFPEDMHGRVANEVRDAGRRLVVPSTGLLAIIYILGAQDYRHHIKNIYGFSFGMWDGHDEVAELSIIEKLCSSREDLRFRPTSKGWPLRRELLLSRPIYTIRLLIHALGLQIKRRPQLLRLFGKRPARVP